jgi:ribosomal protein S18 acetylase RimI-like enzyme
MAKKYKCPYCNDKYIRKDLVNHVDKEHEDIIPDGFESAQVVYDAVNGTKGAGRCRVCNRPTKWNSSSKRYDVLCENPMCKQKMREEYQKNMLRVHGTYNILTSDEQQKKMLANRSISGKYKFTDGGVVTYTGSYEKKFLEFADKVMQIPSKDIMAPGPTIEYEMNGEKHFYITDFLYIPYNLIIEVKDGGSNPNNKNSVGMQSSRQRTIEKEKLITDRGEYNYLRLTDNQFVQLLEIFMDIKKALIEGNEDKIVRIHESAINESKSTIDKNYKPKGKKNLSSFKRVHITEAVIDKYKKEYPFLKHVRCKDTKEYTCDGYIWFDSDELVSMVGSCEYTDDKTKWIVSLEITKNYKGYGLSKQILDYAVKNMNCKYLSVNKNNEIAKKVYDNYGFKVYQESETMYYMTIDKNLKEATDIFTSGDFAEYREIGEKRLKELMDEDTFHNDIMNMESVNKSHHDDNLSAMVYAYTSMQYLSEANVLNEKDIYYNKDKFDSGEINLCFITGHSGSGKSTMARNMEQDNIEWIGLDDVMYNKLGYTLTELKTYSTLVYSFFTTTGKKYYYDQNDVEKGIAKNIEDYDKKLINDFIDYALNYAKSHKNKKFILEGIWLYEFIEPSKLKDSAVYIKGTSALISTIRAATRDSKNKFPDKEDKFARYGTWLDRFRKSFFNGVTGNNDTIFAVERKIKKYRDYFSKLDKVEESLDISNFYDEDYYE